MKVQKFLCLIVILFFVSSCIKIDKKYDPVIIWQSSKIKYTAPIYYVDGIKYKSKISFIHQLTIKNESIDTMKVNVENNIYELTKGEYFNVKPVYKYGILLIEPNDSVSIEVSSTEKFTVDYNLKTIDDSIYNKGNKMLLDSKLIYVINNDTIEIKKIELFDTTPISIHVKSDIAQ